jgi:catechol 2,3-dioxygenase-like lactoylglutathione lyase family enzyme
MIAAIAPQFFTSNLAATLTYYQDKLGFATQFLYGEPPHYARAIRDGRSIFFRNIQAGPTHDPEKYREEWLDTYIIVEQIDTLYAEYLSKEVTMAREIGSMPWAFREFVIKDCDGRLLCFGQSTEYS